MSRLCRHQLKTADANAHFRALSSSARTETEMKNHNVYLQALQLLAERLSMRPFLSPRRNRFNLICKAIFT